MIHIRPTTDTDLFRMKPTTEDRHEAMAAGHAPVFPPKEECVSLVQDFPHKLYRLLAIGGNVGDQVWFVTDQSVRYLNHRERQEFRKCIIEYRDKMLETYPVLWNFVWLGNKSHIRFLKSIGAVFENEFTLNGQFQLFTIRR